MNRLTILLMGVSLFASNAMAGSISNVPGTLDTTMVDPAPALYPHFICASGCNGGSNTGAVSQAGVWSVGISNFPTLQTVTGTVSIGNFPASETVTGSVVVPGVATAVNQPGLNVDGGALAHIVNWPSSQAVSGSVAVSNLPALQPVSGTISVGNFPASQAVNGTVTVGNFPTSQTITGSVVVPGVATSAQQPGLNSDGGALAHIVNWPSTQPVSGSVAVSNLLAVQPVSGTISVGNFPTTQTVSGTLTVGSSVGFGGAGSPSPYVETVQGVTGGTPVTIAESDGADATLGSKSDAASGSGSASVVAILKQIHLDESAPIATGTSTIGATFAAPYSTVDASGAVTTGGSFQTVFALNTSRHGCTIQNPTTASEVLYVHADAGTASTANSFSLPVGATFNCAANGIVLTDLVSVEAATAGHAFVAKSQ